MVEQLTLNQPVEGSSPSRLTRPNVLSKKGPDPLRSLLFWLERPLGRPIVRVSGWTLPARRPVLHLPLRDLVDLFGGQ